MNCLEKSTGLNELYTYCHCGKQNSVPTLLIDVLLRIELLIVFGLMSGRQTLPHVKSIALPFLSHIGHMNYVKICHRLTKVNER